jgi:hypothetical protein
MNRIFKIALLAACVVGSFGAYRFVAAQESQAGPERSRVNFPNFSGQSMAEPHSVGTNHVLDRTYIANGNYGMFVAASTNVQIGPQITVECPGTSGTCTIQADMWIQNGNGSDKKANENAICLEVDGVTSSGCPYTSGETPIDGGFVQSSSSQSISGITTGNHTVQTYFSTVDGAQVNYYNSTYRVYKP